MFFTECELYNLFFPVGQIPAETRHPSGSGHDYAHNYEVSWIWPLLWIGVVGPYLTGFTVPVCCHVAFKYIWIVSQCELSLVQRRVIKHWWNPTPLVFVLSYKSYSPDCVWWGCLNEAVLMLCDVWPVCSQVLAQGSGPSGVQHVPWGPRQRLLFWDRRLVWTDPRAERGTTTAPGLQIKACLHCIMCNRLL